MLAILMTCFNRRELTLECIRALPAAVAGKVEFSVFLVDDNSKDGTSEAVRAEFPNVKITKGSGDLYWNGGMRRAWKEALPAGADFYLWLNDDTVLRPGSIRDMMDCYEHQNFERTIITGCTVDPVTKSVTYGGYRKVAGFSQLRFRRLTADETHCDTMNGNCVLIPQCAVVDVGINSGKYRHAFGDNDYGLRATRSGYRIVELKDAVAEQEQNLSFVKNTSVLTIKNWRNILLHPKGVPMREWWLFCSAHGGLLGPVNFFWRYVKMLRFYQAN